MKILHAVEFYDPSVGGMQQVVKQISERLVKFGHSVTIATTKLPQRKYRSLNGVSISEFNISGNFVTGLKGEVDKYREFLLNSNFDVITNFAAQQWSTDIALPILKNIKSKKIFVPTGFSALYNPQYSHYFEKMKTWLNDYDMNIFLSNDYRDINFARENGISKIILVPNGAGEDEFLQSVDVDIKRLLNIPATNKLILTVGSHTGMKGHAEAINIFRKANIKNSTLLIIANGFGIGCSPICQSKQLIFSVSPFRVKDHKQLIVSSLNRIDTIAAYQQADLFLFPSNIECSPLVLFECMASKTPFLTTDVGNSKEIIDWSKSGILLPTIKSKLGYSKALIDESALILENLLMDSEKLKTMRDMGFQIWQESFTWEKIAKDYENLYSQVIAKGS
jgi:glycosyltransferase involved in cell wall biosynthesis